MGKFDTLSPLRKWVISNKYFIKTSDPRDKKAEATHYLLDGGIWKIPLNEYQTFLQLLATDLNFGEKHYISENKTNVFKFICDLDFYDQDIISVAQVEKVVKIIQEIVNEYFGDQRIIICGADNKIVNELVKSGFHLVFPKLWITVETSKKLRILIINKLIETFQERESYNKWEDVVDLSIYEDNGLRMVGCRKIGICKGCKNKKETRENCQLCDGVGKKDENRIYKPISVLPKSEESYLNTVKTSKKSHINSDNIFQLMLMQIPGISSVSALALSHEFQNMGNLLDSFKQENNAKLENVKLASGRKLNKNIIVTLKQYLG